MFSTACRACQNGTRRRSIPYTPYDAAGNRFQCCFRWPGRRVRILIARRRQGESARLERSCPKGCTPISSRSSSRHKCGTRHRCFSHHRRFPDAAFAERQLLMNRDWRLASRTRLPSSRQWRAYRRSSPPAALHPSSRAGCRLSTCITSTASQGRVRAYRLVREQAHPSVVGATLKMSGPRSSFRRELPSLGLVLLNEHQRGEYVRFVPAERLRSPDFPKAPARTASAFGLARNGGPP